jgi:GDP-L-fucose synthase
MAEPEGYPLTGKRVWVAGHRGMLGSALVRRLERENSELLLIDRADVDLTDQAAVQRWIERTRPDAALIAAAKVGGILANETYPADFLHENLMIASNVIGGAWKGGVERLLFLGSSCVYPKHAPQPIPESALLTGPLEPTNEWYALAKIAGIKLCQAYQRQHGADFISAMPTNLYGPGDNYDLHTGHVLPALVRKAHEAKVSGARSLVVWGTGAPRREFLHVEDCADALVHILKFYRGLEPVNVGFGEDITILELTRLVCEVVGFKGSIEHDLSKPDGTPRKLVNSDKLRALGWKPGIDLRTGLADTYRAFLRTHSGDGTPGG